MRPGLTRRILEKALVVLATVVGWAIAIPVLFVVLRDVWLPALPMLAVVGLMVTLEEFRERLKKQRQS
jgi:hypothetical protein